MATTDELEKAMTKTYWHVEIEIRATEKLANDGTPVGNENAALLGKGDTKQQAFNEVMAKVADYLGRVIPASGGGGDLGLGPQRGLTRRK